MPVADTVTLPEIGTPERERMEIVAIRYGDEMMLREESITKALRMVVLRYGWDMAHHVEQVWITRLTK